MLFSQFILLTEKAPVTSGTYCAYSPDSASKKAIALYMEQVGLSGEGIAPDKLHCTVLYSRKEHPNFHPDPTRTYEAQCKGFTVFGTSVVMLIECPGIVERHNNLMKEHGATYDFPVYTPHISLSYVIPEGFSIHGLPHFSGAITLGSEFKEAIVEDFKETLAKEKEEEKC